MRAAGFLVRLAAVLRALGLPGAADGLVSRVIQASSRLDVSRFAPREALVLLPRCLQREGCDADLLASAGNCRGCGGCPVGEILAAVRERGGLRVAVVGGGEAAVAAVVESGARLVVAVACERELAEGVLRCPGVRIVGIPNERPHGPCRSTTVDVGRVTAVLAGVGGGGDAA